MTHVLTLYQIVTRVCTYYLCNHIFSFEGKEIDKFLILDKRSKRLSFISFYLVLKLEPYAFLKMDSANLSFDV